MKALWKESLTLSLYLHLYFVKKSLRIDYLFCKQFLLKNSKNLSFKVLISEIVLHWKFFHVNIVQKYVKGDHTLRTQLRAR